MVITTVGFQHSPYMSGCGTLVGMNRAGGEDLVDTKSSLQARYTTEQFMDCAEVEGFRSKRSWSAGALGYMALLAQLLGI